MAEAEHTLPGAGQPPPTAEEICRERRVSLSHGVFHEATNLWFQGYRPSPPALAR